MKKFCIICICIFCSIKLFSQPYSHIYYADREYVNGLNGIKFSLKELPFGRPIITLNSSDMLILEFDDLEEESRYLKYTLIHCTYDWKPSSLLPIEYLNGMFEDQITDVTTSFNTSVFYMHYKTVFPNSMIKPKLSGNYLLFVYDDTPEYPVLTRRLMVKEPSSVFISGEVHQATDVANMFKQQEVDFIVKSGQNYAIHNPSLYLHATILQNGRWDNAIEGLICRSNKPGEYSFDYDNGKNCFNGGSGFRTFDTKSLRYNSDHVVSTTYQNQLYHIFLAEDIARPYSPYKNPTTLRGSCYFKNEDFPEANREDYVVTHFALRTDFPVTEGNIYVYGELTDWQIRDEARLQYNEKSNYHETFLLLKQGYYNYQYVYIKKGSSLIDETYIEGSHWETDNEYTTLIYLQDEGLSYDKLVGVSKLYITK